MQDCRPNSAIACSLACSKTAQKDPGPFVQKSPQHSTTPNVKAQRRAAFCASAGVPCWASWLLWL